MPFRIVHISDLHLDNHPGNLPAAVELARNEPADLYLVGGDNGGNNGIRTTVAALREIAPGAPVAWIKGNHDLWGHEYVTVWSDCPDLDASYLELANLDLPECTVVGTYGHYDYGAGLASISHDQYETFTDGRVIWNDRYIQRLGKTNPEIAAELTEQFALRYRAAVERGRPIVVLTHSVPFGPTDDNVRSFVSAYCANTMLGEVLLNAAIKPSVAFCGHTHRPARWEDRGFPVINVGSDYKHVRIAHFSI